MSTIRQSILTWMEAVLIMFLLMLPMVNVNTSNAAPEHNPSAAQDVRPDNTAVNARDRNHDSLTSDQHPMNSADTELSARVRRALMKDDSLSTYAKNVKIISQDGNVTLVGPVRSEQEKQRVCDLTRSAAGVKSVADQLKVAPESKS